MKILLYSRLLMRGANFCFFAKQSNLMKIIKGIAFWLHKSAENDIPLTGLGSITGHTSLQMYMWYSNTMEIENNVKVLLQLAIYPQVHFTHVSDHPHMLALVDQILVLLNICTEMSRYEQYIYENNQLVVGSRHLQKLHPM